MMITLESQDLDLCARAVTVMATGDTDDLKAALAWTLRNRFLERAKVERPSTLAICNALLREATGSKAASLPPPLEQPDPDWCRALAINCLVWSGDLVDPTSGATSCHRHDKTARWATKRVPTALIGAYIFLR
jgi:hypothetical protein